MNGAERPQGVILQIDPFIGGVGVLSGQTETDKETR